MASIRQFSFPDNTKITAQVTDKTNNYLWVAYQQNGDGNCLIEKQNIFSPDEIYFTLERAVTQITGLDIIGTSLCVSYNDATLLGEIISTTNPLTSTVPIPYPGGIAETPIAVLSKNAGNAVFFLLPGSITGENAKVLKYDTTGIFDTTIDLIKTGEVVYNASSMTIDDDFNLWIVTDTSPANLVRAYRVGPSIWDFEVTPIV